MKLLFAVLLATVVSKALAFTVVRATSTPVRSLTTTELGIGGIMAGGDDLWGQLNSLEGPSICYGPEGILAGIPELEIKEYDNFDMFCNALKQAGLDKILRDATQKYTVLVPVNSGVLAFKEFLDEDILKYHILKGDIYSDEFEGQLETLQGEKVTCRVEFRKVIVDDAFIGQENNHTYGTKYPTDVICDNGVIHAIKHVLRPGFVAPTNPWTGNDTASTPWASGST